jgi:hypothetical protein
VQLVNFPLLLDPRTVACRHDLGSEVETIDMSLSCLCRTMCTWKHQALSPITGSIRSKSAPTYNKRICRAHAAAFLPLGCTSAV